MESLSMVAHVGYALDWLLFLSDRAKVLTLGSVEDLANHLVGAVLAPRYQTWRLERMIQPSVSAQMLRDQASA
jgi:hypothetical protein